MPRAGRRGRALVVGFLRRCGARAVVVALGVVLSGCSTVGYYWQAAHGEMSLLSAREPVSRLVAAPATPAELKARLRLAEQARRFASSELHLPDNASYTTYADLQRPYAVWNVYATPEFSVQPRENCFPIAGCVAYRGYFSHAAALADAARWRAQGDDTAVFGVPTFSTLGWFSDPILSTMMRWDDATLVGEIFHELAHQEYYVAGDTQFNESYANFVEREGLRQWRAARSLPASGRRARERADQFTRLVLGTRGALAKLYATDLSKATMRARKAALLADLHERYLALRNGPWHGYTGYDGFFDEPLNNARLVPFGLYDQWVPGFCRLFKGDGGDWPRFYASVKALGAQAKPARDARLRELTAAARGGDCESLA
ncbi:MAG TPA: aminopeptidase [Nevskiaceae bacterium]